MGLRALEFGFLALFALSVTFFFDARRQPMAEQVIRTKRAMLFTGTGVILFAYPLGWWRTQDIVAAIGLIFFWQAARHRPDDLGYSRMFLMLAGVCLALWVWLYEMTWNQYFAGFSEAAACTLFAELCLLIWCQQPPARRKNCFRAQLNNS